MQLSDRNSSDHEEERVATRQTCGATFGFIFPKYRISSFCPRLSAIIWENARMVNSFFLFFPQFLLPLCTYLIFSTLRQHTLLAKAHHGVVGKIVLDRHGGIL